MDTETEKSPHRPGWVSIALIASLCLNFLFIGLFGAAIWQRFDTHRPPPHADMRPNHQNQHQNPHQNRQQGWQHARMAGHGVLSPRIMMDMLPEKAGALHQILHARRAGLRPLRQQAIRARTDLHTLLQKAAYSDVKVRAALDKVKAADSALEAYALESLRQCYVILSPAERRKMASVTLEQMQRFQQRRGHGRAMGRGMGHGGVQPEHGGAQPE